MSRWLIYAIINRLYSHKNIPEAQNQPQGALEATQSVNPDVKNVLIIEDERPLGHALELKIGHSGFKATVASNGTEALQALKNGSFDVLLLDLILPEIDGFALLKEIRVLDKDVKIIILSNLGQDEDKERVAPYEISEYFVKSNTPLAAVVSAVQSVTQS